jgi:hypothetical protein
VDWCGGGGAAVWIVEVDGRRLVIDTNGSQDSSSAQAVLDSIKFTPSPEARFRTGGQLDFKLAAFLSLTAFALA